MQPSQATVADDVESSPGSRTFAEPHDLRAPQAPLASILVLQHHQLDCRLMGRSRHHSLGQRQVLAIHLKDTLLLHPFAQLGQARGLRNQAANPSHGQALAGLLLQQAHQCLLVFLRVLGRTTYTNMNGWMCVCVFVCVRVCMYVPARVRVCMHACIGLTGRACQACPISHCCEKGTLRQQTKATHETGLGSGRTRRNMEHEGSSGCNLSTKP